jgi:hypothetical protein
LTRAKKYEIPFFFTNHVTTIDEVHGLLQYHPTDMYICEELGFSIDKVSKILHDNNIKVRVYPNICQSSFSSTPSIKTFFIRPEDIVIYSLYVDVFELISDKERQQIIYKIYKQGQWLGNLSEIIPSFKGELDGRFILNPFGLIRTKCKKRCMYDLGSCTVCEKFLNLGDTLKENNIFVKRKKK